eukprot:SAG31_NODE_2297_length_5987_cov_10.665251_4_plen_98_part_00
MLHREGQQKPNGKHANDDRVHAGYHDRHERRATCPLLFLYLSIRPSVGSNLVGGGSLCSGRGNENLGVLQINVAADERDGISNGLSECSRRQRLWLR